MFKDKNPIQNLDPYNNLVSVFIHLFIQLFSRSANFLTVRGLSVNLSYVYVVSVVIEARCTSMQR